MSGGKHPEVPEHCYLVRHECLKGLLAFDGKFCREHAASQIRILTAEHDIPVRGYAILESLFLLMVWMRAPKELAVLMKSLSRRLTAYYNSHHDHEGSIWKSHFQAALIEPGKHELRTMRYVERQPMRKELVRTANQYPYSSFADRLRDPEGHWLQDSKSYTDLGATPQERLAEYREYIKRGPDSVDVTLVENALARNSLIASARYAKELGLDL